MRLIALADFMAVFLFLWVVLNVIQAIMSTNDKELNGWFFWLARKLKGGK